MKGSTVVGRVLCNCFGIWGVRVYGPFRGSVYVCSGGGILCIVADSVSYLSIVLVLPVYLSIVLGFNWFRVVFLEEASLNNVEIVCGSIGILITLQ